MAGFYSDVPGQRVPYHRDGSVVLAVNRGAGTILTTFSTADKNAINDESSSNVTMTTGGAQIRLAVLFPQPMDIVGYQLAMGNVPINQGLVYSFDTTNGIDGTWTTLSLVMQTSYTFAHHRTEITLPTIPSGITALGFQGQQGSGANARSVSNCHIYGRPTTLRGLQAWHPTLDQALGGAHFDWGDVPLDADDQLRDFRIKNAETTDTASSVVLTAAALTDPIPTNLPNYDFSDDGVTWATSLSLGNLVAGAISPVLTVRRGSNGRLGLGSVQFLADATWP